jgi:GNAT superfamily N-acetyltransferase
MSTRIEIVDPVAFAGIASGILQAAWKPPCLHYSVDYLAWQFSFPSHLPRVGVIAYLDDRAVGCIAVTARHFASAAETFSAYVLSFAAVAPSAGRRGLASAMYAALLEALPLDTPIVVFAEPASIGERVMLKSLERASFRHRPLAPCRAIGFLTRANAPARSSMVAETVSYTTFASAARTSGQHGTLWTDITPDHFDHYRHDPRPRAMVTVHDDAGNPLGTAMFVDTEILSAQGVQRVPMLDSLSLAEPSPDALAAVFESAATRAVPGGTVIASNLSCVDGDVVRAAGARTLPSSFNAHAFVKGQTHVIETAASLNLEVT